MTHARRVTFGSCWPAVGRDRMVVQGFPCLLQESHDHRHHPPEARRHSMASVTPSVGILSVRFYAPLDRGGHPPLQTAGVAECNPLFGFPRQHARGPQLLLCFFRDILDPMVPTAREPRPGAAMTSRCRKACLVLVAKRIRRRRRPSGIPAMLRRTESKARHLPASHTTRRTQTAVLRTYYQYGRGLASPVMPEKGEGKGFRGGTCAALRRPDDQILDSGGTCGKARGIFPGINDRDTRDEVGGAAHAEAYYDICWSLLVLRYARLGMSRSHYLLSANPCTRVFPLFFSWSCGLIPALPLVPLSTVRLPTPRPPAVCGITGFGEAAVGRAHYAAAPALNCRLSDLGQS